jgi:dethiobiotin synthetase
MNKPIAGDLPDSRVRSIGVEPVRSVGVLAGSALTVEVSQLRISNARPAYATRRVDLSVVRKLIKAARPVAGDLLLARVDIVGQHTKLELPTGRRSTLYVGDEIIVAYGARYAPDQFEAVVPEDIGQCDLVAGGGIAASVLTRHGKMAKATRITPMGLLADAQGHRLNVRQFALPEVPGANARPLVIAVAGTSMNAGKTTTAAGLIQGLTRAGLKVGAAKVTGTGSGGDAWSMQDAGASPFYDFTDMGHATTAGLRTAELEHIVTGLIDQLAARDTEIIIIEIADGVLQKETSALLQSSAVRERIDGVLFAAGDAMGAIGGVEWLRKQKMPVIGVSGLISMSPLATREAEADLSVPVIDLATLMDPQIAPKLCFSVPESVSLTSRHKQ